MAFNGRQPLMEDDLLWKVTFDGRQSLTLYGPGGADLPTLTRIPKFLIFALQTHAEIG